MRSALTFTLRKRGASGVLTGDCDLQTRAELEPIDDDDESTVQIDLLPLLAHPFSEHDKQR